MLPVVSIVGRPNVGKSTLFNRLTATRDALVDDIAGVTRDRLYGVAHFGERQFLVVDTGGIGEDDSLITRLIATQVDLVLEESDAIIFLVDAVDGVTVVDEKIADKLEKISCPVILAVNKSEGLNPDNACAEFYSLGIGEPTAVSAQRGSGISHMLESVVGSLQKSEDPLWLDPGPKVAVIGKPNVGKSTLINSILSDERLIVSSIPGTTRDSVTVPLEYRGKRFRFIDTAGVRRRSKVDKSLEKLSVVKTLQAIEAAHVAVLVIDGTDDIADQDAALAGLIRRAGRAVVIAVNKSDRIPLTHRPDIERHLRRKLAFAPHHEAIYISGLRTLGIGKFLRAVDKAYQSSMVEMRTPVLNRHLRDAVMRMAPPMSHKRPVKLKFAHQGGKNPPVVIIHGNNVDRVADNYRRYLEKYFRERFDLFGADIRVIFKAGDNPFKRRK